MKKVIRAVDLIRPLPNETEEKNIEIGANMYLAANFLAKEKPMASKDAFLAFEKHTNAPICDLVVYFRDNMQAVLDGDKTFEDCVLNQYKEVLKAIRSVGLLQEKYYKKRENIYNLMGLKKPNLRHAGKSKRIQEEIKKCPFALIIKKKTQKKLDPFKFKKIINDISRIINIDPFGFSLQGLIRKDSLAIDDYQSVAIKFVNAKLKKSGFEPLGFSADDIINEF